MSKEKRKFLVVEYVFPVVGTQGLVAQTYRVDEAHGGYFREGRTGTIEMGVDALLTERGGRLVRASGFVIREKFYKMLDAEEWVEPDAALIA